MWRPALCEFMDSGLGRIFIAGVGRTPMAVDPSLMASREYSTWKRRPSGEKVLEMISLAPTHHASQTPT